MNNDDMRSDASFQWIRNVFDPCFILYFSEKCMFVVIINEIDTFILLSLWRFCSV